MPSELEDLQSKNRNFICSCQKAYLSYAALFTHIKQKHGGKAPGQIVRPRSLNKRGRPRKNEKLASQKGLRGESSDGFLVNNNLKNINFANESNFNQNQSRFKCPLTKGFTSYRNSPRFQQHNSGPSKHQNSSAQQPSFEDEQMQILKQDEEDNIEFANPNNELSSNTLALASIIIGLQQFFKDVNHLELVRDHQLESFSSYIDLKRFHSQKLLQKNQQKPDQDVFLLGNIICAFLSFCHQTLEGKVAYQQIVLLIVCLLEHIKERNTGNFLISCRKEVVHECLPSFFQQYLDTVIIKSRLNFWIFKSNNSFKVLIWFLNWLSAIEANYLKNSTLQQIIHQDPSEEEQAQQEEAVEFQHPTFLRQVLKGEQNQAQKKTLSSIEKKGLENECLNGEGNEVSKSLEQSGGEEQERVDEQVSQLQECFSGSQMSKNQGDNDNNGLIGMERLSSEVR